MLDKIRAIIHSINYLKYIFKKKKREKLLIKKDLKKKFEIVKQIKKNGFYLIENFISKKDCAALKKKINLYIKKYPEKTWSDKLASDIRIFGSESICPVIKKFSNDRLIIDIGSILLKRKVKSLMVMANKVICKKKNLGSGGGWHKDSYARQFKAILYLSDVGYENGPFQIFKKSNNIFYDFSLFFKLKKNFKDTRFSNKEINKISSAKNISTICGKAGTLLLVETSLIHRGKPIKDGVRYAITNYIYPIEELKNYKSHFQPRVNN